MYWSSQTIESNQGLLGIIMPFNVDAIKQGAYELCMGAQAAVSSDGRNRRTDLSPREPLCIPGGQFGLLLTEEIVSVPTGVVAFISLKTTIKSLGLVNVSGFHVDPGYKGRLKFWVYNAGNQDIQILRGDRVFLIWFADLDSKVRDPYPNRSGSEQYEITATNLRGLQGRLASPAALAKQIGKLKNRVKLLEWICGTVVVVLIGFCIALATPLIDFFIKPVLARASLGPSSPASTTTFPTSEVAKPSIIAPVDSASISRSETHSDSPSLITPSALQPPATGK
jgi:dCTP deaminase